MFTEDEAKTKWCPFAGTPRFTHQSEECQASSCMAWRWSDGHYETVTMDNRCIDEEMTKKKGVKWIGHTDGPPPAPVGDGWEPMEEPRQADGFIEGVLKQKWRRPRGMRHGYCGACKP